MPHANRPGSAPSERLTALLIAGEEASSSDESPSPGPASPQPTEGGRAEWAIAAHAELRAVHDALGQTAASLRAREAALAQRERVLAARAVNEHRELAPAGSSMANAAGAQPGAADPSEVARDEAVLRRLLQDEAARLTARTREALEERASAQVQQLEQIADDLRRRHAEVSRAKLAAERSAAVRGGKRHAARLAARLAEQAVRADEGAAVTHAREMDLRLSRSRSLVSALLPLWSEAAQPTQRVPSMDDDALAGAVDMLSSLPFAHPTAVALLSLLWHVASSGAAAASTTVPSKHAAAATPADTLALLALTGSENVPPGSPAFSAPLSVNFGAGAAASKGAVGRGSGAAADRARPGAHWEPDRARPGAQWERRLLRHLCSALEPARATTASLFDPTAPLIGAMGGGGMSTRPQSVAAVAAAAAARLLPALLLLRLSLRLADATGGRGGGGGGGAGGAHVREVTTALRALQPSLTDAAARSQLTILAFPDLFSLLPSPHKAIGMAASGLLLGAVAAPGVDADAALMALASPHFFRAAAAALRREEVYRLMYVCMYL